MYVFLRMLMRNLTVAVNIDCDRKALELGAGKPLDFDCVMIDVISVFVDFTQGESEAQVKVHMEYDVV
jgi:hypothetical protein